MMSMAHGREVWSRCHSRRKHRLGDVRRAHAQYDRFDVETADDRRAAVTRICDAPSALEKVFQTEDLPGAPTDAANGSDVPKRH